MEELLLATSILAIAALTISNVFCRSLLGFSLSFTEELSQFLIIGVTFIGLSYAASRGRHIRMTAAYDQLSQRWRKRMMVLISGLTSLLMLALAAFSVEYIRTMHFLESVSPVLQVPLYLVYLLVPLGLLLTAAQYVLTGVRNLTSTDVYIAFEQRDEYESPVAGEM